MALRYVRMPIEAESPEEQGYSTILFNLSESSMRDRSVADLLDPSALGDVVLNYGPHRGSESLRRLIAEAAGGGLTPMDVLTTTGAAGALFLISTTLLSPQDHLVVVRPNYATNLETPRAIGCEISFVDLRFEDGFALDVSEFERRLKPNTKLISITSPHNPTGTCVPAAVIEQLAALATRAGIRLLVDETYREMVFDGACSPVAAAALGPACISVASVSKSHGIPGVRVGWVISRDPVLLTRLLAAKEQIGIAGSVIDELLAEAALKRWPQWRPEVQATIRRGKECVRRWLERESRVEWVEPSGGCVCFPRLRAEAHVDLEKFYRLLDERRVCVGAGHWFEQDKRFFRVGFGYPLAEELTAGLQAISAALDASTMGS